MIILHLLFFDPTKIVSTKPFYANKSTISSLCSSNGNSIAGLLV